MKASTKESNPRRRYHTLPGGQDREQEAGPSEPGFIVRVFEMTMMSVDKRPVIVILSVVVSEPIDQDFLRVVFAKALDEKNLNDLARVTKDSEVFRGQLWRTGGIKDLDAMSKAIVTEVDTCCIEPDRKLQQELRDLGAKPANKKSN
jgi:hypothetical protein